MSASKPSAFERYILLLQRRAGLVLLVLSALAGVGVWAASHLALRADFRELLPPNLRSVRDLRVVDERLGGAGNFIIVAESPDFEANKAYASELASRIRSQVDRKYIREVEYENHAQREFFEKNKYLYADVEDLESIHNRLQAKLEFDLTCKNPLFFDFTGQCDNDPGFDISDLQEKYKSEEARYDQHIDSHYTNAEGTLLAILVQPTSPSAAVEKVREFLRVVLPVVNSLDPADYHPEMKIHFTGSYAQADEELRTMIHDIRSTALACGVLVALVLFLYYRSLRQIFFISATVLFGLSWTYGLAQPTLGMLTTQTAVLGSIILGNGINNAIIFLARYLEERRSGALSVEESICRAASTTVGATFTAAFTTAAAFAVLTISDMRAYKQFGFLGAAGMVACWIAAYTALPALVALGERIRPSRPKEFETAHERVTGALGRLIHGSPRGVALAGAALTIAGLVGSYFFWSDPWEKDYSNIRSERSVSEGSGYWNRRLMDEVFKLSLTPLAILTESREQAHEVYDTLMAEREKNPQTMMDSVRSFDSFVPENQSEKLEWIAKIKKLLDGQAIKFVKKSQRKELDLIRESIDLTPITEVDIPKEIREHFTELDGSLGKIVYVFPDNSRQLWIMENVVAFSNEVYNAIKGIPGIAASSDSMIIADLLQLVQADAPFVLGAAFLAVVLLLLFNFRSITITAKVLLPLAVAYTWLGALIYVEQIHLTFINFIVLPMAIGIGMDYAANVFHRYELEGEGSIESVIRTTGGAVILCSITTIIGYASLLAGESQALSSLGKLGLLSEICTVSAAVVVAPAVLVLLERRRRAS